MKSRYAKVLHRVGGLTLVGHVLNVARNLSNDISVVVGHSADQVKAAIWEVTFIDQKEQLGTGRGVLGAGEKCSGYAGDVLVMPGDVPLIGTATLDAYVRFHREGGFCASVLTADLEDPRGYGRIVRRNNGELDSIVEHRDASPDVLKIRGINLGVYVFKSPGLFESLRKNRKYNM